MKTKELIEGLRDIEIDYSLSENQEDIVDEVVQKLLEFGELKKMLTDVVDPLIEVYEFLLADLGEDE